jgi:hypothetical protein
VSLGLRIYHSHIIHYAGKYRSEFPTQNLLSEKKYILSVIVIIYLLVKNIDWIFIVILMIVGISSDKSVGGMVR